ncbi:hypothetical protein ACFO1B_03100 [Dactylosporangium siamense]|uniref:Uncharacterized protein n=1 Tax=Dactylosporangium siamense TaxID=685454 RepID=A0A919U8U6_9ACTN|nr:hypothetical protein [Dactylosporangium siamense]GIG43135.1 hypothetical protein Dsi01nite_011760 [Dactylosporangium siamense]
MAAPLVELVAHVEGRLDDETAQHFLQSYERDRATVNWVSDSAEAFDEVDQDGARLVGLTHTFPRPGPWVTPAVERRLLAEVRWLVAWLGQVSGDHGLVFAIRYDDRDIGRIRRGVIEEAVNEELIAVWQRDLERLERDSPRR